MSMLEEASKKKIHELVDYIGGTSIGGICALGFVATEDHDRPLWQVKDLVELFDEHGTSIFPTSRGIKKVYTRVAQLWNVKYSPKPLERVLRQYFGNLNLSDTLIPALATAMKIPETETYTFESEKAQVNEHDDYLMTDVMRATSAAPTYFPGHTFSNIVGGPSSTFVDGGIWINNPTELVYKRIIKLYEHSSQKADQTNVLMVSLGTGSNPLKSPLAKQVGLLQAVAPTIESLMAANSHGVHQEMERLLGNNYCRLQPSLATVIDLADASTEALQALEDAAHSLRPHIEAVARRLAENKDRKHPESL
jgi:patatin-like phospholipase/acyl hydrolase